MKKFLALLLALAMVLSMAACGGNAKPQPENTPPANTETTQPEAQTPPEEEAPTVEVTPLKCGDSIDNDNFLMTFDSVELVPEYSYQTSEHSTTSLYVEDGYQILMVKGHFENKATDAIQDSAFVMTATVNGTYTVDGYDVRMNFCRSKYFEIDPYTDQDYVLYINIPDKLADMFETVTFTIGFNDDLSIPTTVWNSDGTSTTEIDQLYALSGGLS